MLLTPVSSLTLAQPDLYYLPRHGINTADCYRYQRDVLGTQLQSQGYVEFYCLTHIHQPMLRRTFPKQERQTMLNHKQTILAKIPLADRLDIFGGYRWSVLTVTGKVMITCGFSIPARCTMISIVYTSMMRIPTWHCVDYGVSMLPMSWRISPARIANWQSWITMLLWNNFSSNIRC